MNTKWKIQFTLEQFSIQIAQYCTFTILELYSLSVMLFLYLQAQQSMFHSFYV